MEILNKTLKIGLNYIAVGLSLGNMAAMAEESSGLFLEEIVVTAQKREESLQDVPISISVLGGERLDNSSFTGITEALRTVPGVAATISGQNGGTQLSVRGVTASGPKFVGASTIGYYLDSVPFGLVRSSVLPDVSPYDLDRVEVLRGPQGTLYGANAQNGVVRILTKKPDFDEFEFKARSSISSTERGGENSRMDAAFNLPLVEGKLAARAVVGYQDLSGWIDKADREDANDSEILTGRFKLRAQPTDELSIDLSAWFSRSDYGAPSWSPDNRQSPAADNEPMSTDYDVYGLTVGYDFSSFSLTSSTSYLDYTAHGFQDFSFIADDMRLETIDQAEVFTQEVNLASTHEGSWRWSFGAIYRDADAPELQEFGFFTPLVPVNVIYNSESFAVFGELTRLFMDGQLEVTGGLRYFEDDVTQTELQDFDGVGPLFKSENNYEKTSPRLIFTWHQNDDLTTYASYSEGFRSGADQGLLAKLTVPDFPAFKEDNLKNFEVGAKGGLWGGRIVFDAALYYIDWQDVQQPITIPFDTTFVTGVVNGDSASGAGFEFSTTAQVTEGLTVGVKFGWNDLTNDTEVLTFPATAPEGVVLFEEGSRLNLSPEYTGGVSADYAFPLGNDGYEGRLSISADYSSEAKTQNLSGSTVTSAVSDSLVFGRASFEVGSNHGWALTLFVDNFTDEDDAFSAGPNPNLDIRPRPRTFGLQIDFQQ